MPLTDTAIRNAKPGREARQAFGWWRVVSPDRAAWHQALAHGLSVRRQAEDTGFRHLSDRRSRRRSFSSRCAPGNFLPKGSIRQCSASSTSKRTAIDFRLVAGELLDKMRREGRAAATLAKTQWLLEFAYPAIGSRPIAKITALEILDVLRKIEARQKYETARRVRSTCGMVFRYAIATGRAQRDPDSRFTRRTDYAESKTPGSDH